MNKQEILDEIIKFYHSYTAPEKTFMPGITPIPASGQVITPEDIVAVVDVAMNGWATEGKKCAAFRRGLSEKCGKNHVILTNSGSSASLLAVRSYTDYIKHGKFIVTCATGFPTTVAPIYQCNKIPIYVDIDPETLAPNLNQFKHVMAKYKDDICGVIFAHTLGFPFDEQAYCEIVHQFNQFFIIDCCDALGARILVGDSLYPVGTFADVITLSFFPAHQITSGEGGAVLTNDDDLLDIITSYANWGRDCRCAPGQDNVCGERFNRNIPNLPSHWDHKYEFTRLGYNFKMTEYQAALGLSQLGRLNNFVSSRILNYVRLHSLLSGLIRDGYIETIQFNEITAPSPFGFPIHVAGKLYGDREMYELIEHLEMHKIHTRRVFGGNLTRQPAFRNLPYMLAGDMTGSDEVMENMFWIGIHPALTNEMLDYIGETINDFYKK